MQKGQARVNAWRHAEAHVNARKVVGMSAERSSVRRCAEGGTDESRKVKRAEMRGRW